jgi:hypothetical protein
VHDEKKTPHQSHRFTPGRIRGREELFATISASRSAPAANGKLTRSFAPSSGAATRVGLAQAVESLDFTASGPPRLERLETIKAIDKRIDELDKQERDLIEQAEASGLKL